mmetsp:Transcript_84461/g.192522  ORF Transcript_84461/g.192522 Transcript_84461/m.192522 type:complete len:105 (+) Transcript_84461:237-551(+)
MTIRFQLKMELAPMEAAMKQIKAPADATESFLEVDIKRANASKLEDASSIRRQVEAIGGDDAITLAVTVGFFKVVKGEYDLMMRTGGGQHPLSMWNGRPAFGLL